MAVAPSLLLPFTAFATRAVHPLLLQGPTQRLTGRHADTKERDLERPLWGREAAPAARREPRHAAGSSTG
ncbi:hypothetical protein [Nocardia xishanensis]